jgi:hypothetical protein
VADPTETPPYWHTRTSGDDYYSTPHTRFQFEAPALSLFGAGQCLGKTPLDAIDELIFFHGEHLLASELWLHALTQVDLKESEEARSDRPSADELEETMLALTRLGTVRTFSRV